MKTIQRMQVVAWLGAWGILAAACTTADEFTKPSTPHTVSTAATSSGTTSDSGVRYSVILKPGGSNVADEAGRLATRVGSRVGRQWQYALRGFELYDLSDSMMAS